MGTIQKGTFHAPSEGVGTLKDIAGEVMEKAMKSREYVKEGAHLGHGRSYAFSRIFKGVNAALGVAALLRYLDTDSVLRRIGLSRRRSSLRTMATFGLGAAAGAAVLMLVAPSSGSDTRHALVRGFRTLTRKGRAAMDRVDARIEEVAQSGEGGQGDGGREGSRRGEQRQEGRSESGASRSVLVSSESQPGAPGSPNREANKAIRTS